jgi:hypothetical protein
MNKIAIAFIPLLFLGFVLPDDRCRSTPYVMNITDTITDGPYVLYKNNQIFIESVIEDNGVKAIKMDSVASDNKLSISFNVAADEPGVFFTVKLKEKLSNEKSEYKKVNKYAIISDIEGNFTAFRKLLQHTGVIDTAYNWTFGDGQLVLTGDFFDRGDKVTEVLWLIYSLEEKAKAAGGYVHFVLGNHEIMNMSGDLRYLHLKYLQTAYLLHENYVGGLYGENSELGRWLRTKNIVEKVGNILFMHGGMSSEMNNLDISLNKLNDISRPYYADSLYNYKDDRLTVIYGDQGPFWYRGYYSSKSPVAVSQIDSTLEKYNVKHIATGHTVIADTISFLFKGKLINTDVHHVKGHSEAVLIEDNKFYRVTMHGEKFLVMEK